MFYILICVEFVIQRNATPKSVPFLETRYLQTVSATTFILTVSFENIRVYKLQSRDW